MKARIAVFLCFTISISCFQAFAQDDDAMVKSIQQRFRIYTENRIQEKMYVHLDRPFYLIGETIWFKAYNLSGSSHRFLDLSKVGYLEILDAENNALVQTKFALSEGKGNGSLLIPSTLVSGVYKVRCYTNWMKNFDPDYYFETSVSIVNPFVRFDPERVVKEAEKYDLQFFPEGGHLVKNIKSKVAFRAIGKDGQGIHFNGVLLNNQNDTVQTFGPQKNGIGFFMHTPQDGITYKAVITDSKGQKYEYPLPAAEEQGYTMQVTDSTSNLLKITVSGLVNSDEPVYVYLLSHTRQANHAAERKFLNKGRAVFLLDKNKLGDGISHLTIFNEKTKPVCERLYFRRPEKQLSIEAQLNKSFITREKATMELSAASANAAPEMTNMSVAIYLSDSIQAQPQQDISSYLWLTSDLRGNVESPEYYFQNVSEETDQQLDNLMLTHGWRKFRWENVFASQPAHAEYLPEYDGHFIHARILNKADDSPAKGIETFLAALDVPARLYAAQSDGNGRILFEVRKFTGPKEITLQTDQSRSTTYRFEVASPFSKQFSAVPLPAFYFDKKLENQLLTRSINMQTANAFQPAVFTQRKPMSSDSLAFFGVPDEKYMLDDFTRFPTMEEVLREYVRGVLVRKNQKEFHFRMVDKLLPNTFYKTDPLVLLDGIPVFDIDKIMEFDPLKVKKIELMNARYYLGPATFTGIVSFSTYQSDLAGFELDPSVLVMPYEGIQTEREFYSPKYDSGNAASRIPDFRNLLHWAPDVTTDASGKASIEFYTSDQTGKYDVIIQGITSGGIPGSKKLSFEVGKRNF